jgi:hypothetical protein
MESKIEYLEIFNEVNGKEWNQDYMKKYEEKKDRSTLCQKYSFAIPTEEAIKGIVKHSPIIEIGAGNGYWAHLIEQFGGKIVAFDNNKRNQEWSKSSKHKNYFVKNWFPVKYGDEKEIKNYPDHTLFLCWIEYCGEYGLNCLKRYKGKYFIHIGEGEGGCTANDEFFEYLRKYFKQIKSPYIPRWYGIYDYLEIYKRRVK